jgi:hypothetical protein
MKPQILGVAKCGSSFLGKNARRIVETNFECTGAFCRVSDGKKSMIMYNGIPPGEARTYSAVPWSDTGLKPLG